jgi:hypothetical protein
MVAVSEPDPEGSQDLPGPGPSSFPSLPGLLEIPEEELPCIIRQEDVEKEVDEAWMPGRSFRAA